MRFLNKLLHIFVLTFLYFNFLSQGDYLSFQLLLLCLIAIAQHIKAFITQSSAGVVLINLDEQSLQFRDTLFVPVKLLSADLDFLCAFQSELVFHNRPEILLIPQDVACNQLDVF